MATQIPYQPYSTAQPIPSSGSTGFRVSTDANMFGANVNNAIASVGQTMENVGGEMFNRAVALQEVRNSTEKTELEAKYQLKSGELYTSYESKSGKDAFDSFDALRAQLEAERQGMADSASNDAVKRQFLAGSLGTMGRTVFSAGRHSAAELKKYNMNANQAKIDSIDDSARKQRWSDHDFNEGVKAKVDAVNQMADMSGMPPEQRANLVGKAISDLWANRIQKTADSDGPAARKMLEENKQFMRSDAYDQTNKYVQGQERQVTARNVTDAISAGYAPWFSQNSIDKVNTIDTRLQNVIKWVHQHHPDVQFQVISGKRNIWQQAAAVRAGHSRTMHSHHLNGTAFDAQPQGGTTYRQLEAAIKEGFEATGTPLSSEHDKISSWDPGHYSMPWGAKDIGDPNYRMPEEPVAQRVARGQAWARQYNPSDPLLPDVVADRIRGQYRAEQTDKRDAYLHNTNIINEAMLGGRSPSGDLPTTPEELTASGDDVAAAWAAMDWNQRKPFYAQMAHNAGGHRGWGPGGLENYKTLYALAQSELDEDRQKFLDTEIMKVPGLSTEAQKGFVKAQVDMLHKHKDDPRSNKAMGYMEGDLLAAGITRQNSPDLYLRYRADLGDQIRDFQISHQNRPPSQSEIMQMGRLLLQNQAVNVLGRQFNPDPGWLGGYGHEPLFNVQVPSKDYEAIREDSHWKEEGIEPTDEMIRREYVRALFKRLYSAKIGAGRATGQRFRTATP